MLEKDFKAEHYSNKGGHRERTEFWKVMRLLQPRASQDYSPTKELAWLIRRDMQRDPRSGRR